MNLGKLAITFLNINTILDFVEKYGNRGMI